MSDSRNLTKWRNRAGVIAGLLLVADCAAPPQMAAAPAGPVPSGQARIWFYRVYDPSLSRNIANVDLNGQRVVSVLPGDGPAYRDVPPGSYHIAPESFGSDANQTRDVNLAAGQEIFVKILDDPNVASGGGGHTDFVRDTFYAWVMPPTIARAEMRM